MQPYRNPFLAAFVAALWFMAPAVQLRAIPLWVFSGSGDPAPSITYLVRQTFEGTGYDNGETWTTSLGSPNPDYTTLILQGSESFFGGGTATARARTDFTNQDTANAYFIFHRAGGSNPGGDRTIFYFAPSALDSNQASVGLTSTGALKLNSGGVTATTTDATSIDTNIYIFVSYTKGTGSNAIATLGWSTDGSKPTSGNKFVSITTSTSTGQAGRIYVGYGGTNGGSDFIFDDVRVSAETIPSNP